MHTRWLEQKEGRKERKIEERKVPSSSPSSSSSVPFPTPTHVVQNLTKLAMSKITERWGEFCLGGKIIKKNFFTLFSVLLEKKMLNKETEKEERRTNLVFVFAPTSFIWMRKIHFFQDIKKKKKDNFWFKFSRRPKYSLCNVRSAVNCLWWYYNV